MEEDVHYLNCAYKAPLLKSAENSAIEALIKERNPSYLNPEKFFDTSEIVRESFSKIVDCAPDEVALIPSTSYGFNSVLNNVPAKIGGKAITLFNEFPSGYFSLKKWCERNSQKLGIVGHADKTSKLGKVWNENILNEIDENTSVVLMSSLHWMNGVKFDLKKIGERCKEVGAIFIVDGTQSVGVCQISVKDFHIDALICATYKWLFGPYSVALAFIGEKFHQGKPLEESWMNRTNAKDFSNLTDYCSEYKPMAGRFNVGELSNFILLPMLKCGLEQILEFTPKGILEYCNQLVHPLKDDLSSLGFEFEEPDFFSPHLFSLKSPDGYNMADLKNRLNDNKVVASQRGNNLRISFNVFNNQSDINKLKELI